jgi:hypothetical protein
MEGADQDLRDDDEVRLATRAPLLETPDQARNKQHAGARDETVAPRLAPILPLRDQDLRAEGGQDREAREACELDKDGREGRQRHGRRALQSLCPVACEPHLIESALAETPEPAVESARVQRAKARRDGSEPGAPTQVARGRTLDEAERVDLPRPQVRREHAWPVLAAATERDGDPAHLDGVLCRQILEEDRNATNAP